MTQAKIMQNTKTLYSGFNYDGFVWNNFNETIERKENRNGLDETNLWSDGFMEPVMGLVWLVVTDEDFLTTDWHTPKDSVILLPAKSKNIA